MHQHSPNKRARRWRCTIVLIVGARWRWAAATRRECVNEREKRERGERKDRDSEREKREINERERQRTKPCRGEKSRLGFKGEGKLEFK